MSVFLLLAGSNANAADQPIAGKKLLLKNGKLVLLAKDAGISTTGSDPVGGADSSISLDDGSGSVRFSLPKTHWRTNGAGTLFKYKNALAPGGPSVVKIAKVKSGSLKVVARGLPFAVPNGAATIDVVLSLDGATNTYCMTFAGTGDGNKFLVKDATAGSCATSAPTATPTATAVATSTATATATVTSIATATAMATYTATATASATPTTTETVTPSATPTATPTTTPTQCTGQLVGGFCWFLGATGEDCDTLCNGMGSACDAATVTYAGSGGTDSQCGSVLTALGVTHLYVGQFGCNFASSASGCMDIPSYAAFRCTDAPTSCDASHSSIRRACACQ